MVPGRKRAICGNKTKRMMQANIAIQKGKTPQKMVYMGTSRATDVLLTPLFLIFDGVRRDPQDPIYLFKVKPPLILGFRLPISQEIITPNGKPPGKGRVPHRPPNSPVKGSIGFVPGANLYARATTRPRFVSHPHSRTCLHICWPALIPLIDHLITEADRPRGALPGTLLTFGTKILNSNIYRSIRS